MRNLSSGRWLLRQLAACIALAGLALLATAGAAQAQNPCNVIEIAGPGSPLSPNATVRTTTAAGRYNTVYWQFAGVAGVTYHFDNCSGAEDDTNLYVYLASSPNTPLAFNDDACGPSGLNSSITWTCNTNGIYRVYLTEYSCLPLNTNQPLTYWTSSNAPTLTSLSPTSGPAGTSITLTGTNLAGITAVSFNGTAASVFTTGTGTSATVTVPTGASTGLVTVTTPGGTSNGITFTVSGATPTLTSLNPTSGSVGTTLTLTGTNLTGATGVSINGTAATSVTVVNATSITATVPAGATTGLVTVTTGGGTSNGLTFTVTIVPTLTSLSPATGPVGTSVTLTGTNLTGATLVKFNGTTTTFTVVNATTITATVPTGATSGLVTVTTPGGTSNGITFTVIAAPTLTSLSPGNGPVGTTLTLTGTNLTSATGVSINGTAATSVTVVNATTVTAVVPAGASSGLVTVTTPGGTSNGLAFVVGTPTNNALAFDGIDDYVAGTNAQLPQGNAPRTLEAWVNTTVNAVIFNYGTASTNQRSGILVANGHLYYVGEFNDLQGTIAIGDGRWHHVAAAYDGITLKLYVDGVLDVSSTPTAFATSGANWRLGSRILTGTATGEQFNGRLDEVRVYNTALTLAQVKADMFSTTAALPANQVAYYNFDQGIVGSNNAGITTLLDRTTNGNNGTLTNFALTGTASNWVRSFPTITGISPTSGLVGSSVSLTGTNLTDATGVKFNGTAVAPFATPGNDLTATATVPTGATTGAVSVASATLTAYNGPAFTVTCPLPTAIAQNQTVALAAAGTGTLAATAVNNASTPTSCGTLTYGVQKVVYGQVSENGVLTLTAPAGAVFTGVTFASYGTPSGSNGNYVLGGCNAATSQSVVAGYLMGNNTASIPANNGIFSDPCYGTGKSLAVQAVYTVLAPQVSYTCADVAGPNYVLLTVTDASNNKSTATAQVTVTAPAAATITSISPTAGSVGQTITVTGTNLGAATGLTVNGTAAAIGSNTGTVLTFVVPSGATATGNVVVSAPCTPASIAFTLVGDLTVSTTTTIPAGTYNTLTVTGTGTGTLAGNVVINTAVVVQNGGTLTDGCFVLSGTGTFTLAAGGTLGICSAQGITPSGATGTVQLSGSRSFSTDASYVYNGTAAQATGTGLPAQVRNLTTANAADVALTQATSVVQMLTLSNAGNLTLGSQTLTLLSSAAGTALVVNAGTGIVSGTTGTVQRYLDPSVNTGLGYRHYSAPVSGSTVAGLATAGFAPVLTAAYNTSATPGTTAPFPTVFAYDQARLASATNNLSAFDKGYAVPTSSSPLAVGQGYAVNISATPLVAFVGTLTTGTQVVNLARNSGATAADAGWALVGNPYPAPLDFALIPVSDRPNLDAAMYVFESNAPYTGSYRSYVNGMGTSSLIGSGQGFFVRVSTGQIAGTLVFRNAHRLTSYASQVPVRRSTADTRPLVQLDLRGATGPADALYAYAETGATPAFDAAFDAGKRTNSTGLNLASLAATGEALAIDGRPAFTPATVLNLTVGVPAAGAYSLTAAALNNLPGGLDAFLTDNLAGRTVNLSQQPAYTFSVTTAQAATLLTGRFALTFAARSVLATTTALTAAEVTLFPNPAHAAFTVLVPAVAGAGQVQATLFNALGQTVRQQAAALPAAGARLVVETADLAAGVYTLRLLVGTTTLAKRVVIQ